MGPALGDLSPTQDVRAGSFSPGGERIAYIGRPIGSTDDFELFVCDYEGGNVQRLTTTGPYPNMVSTVLQEHPGGHYTRVNTVATYGHNAQTTWSPDGTKIYYQKINDSGGHPYSSIWEYDLVTGTDTSILEGERRGSNVGDNLDYICPSWDFGDRLCYIKEEGSGKTAHARSMSTGNTIDMANFVFPGSIKASPLAADEYFINGWKDGAGPGASLYRYRNGGYLRVDQGLEHVHGFAVSY